MHRRFVFGVLMVLVLVFCSSVRAEKSSNDFTLSSPAFKNGGMIPLRNAGFDIPGGGNFSIPLIWKGAPEGTKMFVLLMVDRSADNLIHWGVVDIPSGFSFLYEGASSSYMPSGCDEVLNGYGQFGYIGPNPPQGSGIHEYKIIIYALGTLIDVRSNPSFEDLKKAVTDYAIGSASLTGKFLNPPSDQTSKE